MRVLTDAIPDADKLLKSIAEATFAFASGDSRAPGTAKTQDYQKAKKALQKYANDVQKLAAKGPVPATVAPDLLAAAASLIEDVDELIGASQMGAASRASAALAAPLSVRAGNLAPVDDRCELVPGHVAMVAAASSRAPRKWTRSGRLFLPSYRPML